MVVAGHCTDNAQRCTLVVVGEVAGTWACYPHGAAQLGVRLAHSEAFRVAHQILDGARWDHPRQHERTALGLVHQGVWRSRLGLISIRAVPLLGIWARCSTGWFGVGWSVSLRVTRCGSCGV